MYRQKCTLSLSLSMFLCLRNVLILGTSEMWHFRSRVTVGEREGEGVYGGIIMVRLSALTQNFDAVALRVRGDLTILLAFLPLAPGLGSHSITKRERKKKGQTNTVSWARQRHNCYARRSDDPSVAAPVQEFTAAGS
ncbi:hypothetical protein B0H63DRAFT_469093 [Podospora didyma]|uniref:Secreted protein n=1 Tax=Podospora didyma TaxID=330526 RepID=A0AAE0NST9_9PEZI|nr:hypothetical protein B0H63DRAFT_469093 [Podospora didyma]